MPSTTASSIHINATRSTIAPNTTLLVTKKPTTTSTTTKKKKKKKKIGSGGIKVSAGDDTTLTLPTDHVELFASTWPKEKLEGDYTYKWSQVS